MMGPETKIGKPVSVQIGVRGEVGDVFQNQCVPPINLWFPPKLVFESHIEIRLKQKHLNDSIGLGQIVEAKKSFYWKCHGVAQHII